MKYKLTKAEWEEEVAKTVAELPQMPPHGEMRCKGDVILYEIAWIKENGYTYEPKKKFCRCHCTACGGTFYMTHSAFSAGCSHGGSGYGFWDDRTNNVIADGECCLCPECGAEVTAYCKGRHRNDIEIASRGFVQAVNVRGHLAVLMFYVQKFISKTSERVYLVGHRTDGTLIVDGRAVCLAGYADNYFGRTWTEKWKRRAKYYDRIEEISTEYVVPFDKAVVDGSDCEKSGFWEYMQGDGYRMPARYLKSWTKYKNIENLAKAGMAVYLTDAFKHSRYSYGGYVGMHAYDDKYFKEIIDVKQAKPCRMLGLEKDEILVTEYGPHVVLFYRMVRDTYGIRLTNEEIKLCRALSIRELTDLIKEHRVPIIKAIRYMSVKRDLLTGVTENAVRYYRDYLGLVSNVYGRLEKSMLFPKDLKKAHDAVLMLQKEKESEIINEKMAKLDGERETLCFEDEETHLLIRPARTHAEIIKEGKILNHCVARYAEEVANGNTTILFIRKTDEPDMPFYTLEYRDGMVAQNRGKCNCARTEDVRIFEKKWIEFLKEKIKNGRYCVSKNA